MTGHLSYPMYTRYTRCENIETNQDEMSTMEGIHVGNDDR